MTYDEAQQLATIPGAWYAPRRLGRRRPHPRDLRLGAPRGRGHEALRHQSPAAGAGVDGLWRAVRRYRDGADGTHERQVVGAGERAADVLGGLDPDAQRNRTSIRDDRRGDRRDRTRAPPRT